MNAADVIIIGSGPAGAAAASVLRDRTGVIVLEGEYRSGGRIRSEPVATQLCELGATGGYTPSNLPFPTKVAQGRATGRRGDCPIP